MASTVRTVQINVVGDSTSATTAIGKVATESEGAGSRINKAFSGVLGMLNQSDLLGPFGAGLEQISGLFDTLNEKAGKLSTGMKLMTIGGVGMGVGGLLAAAAGPDQQAAAGLKQAIENAGGSYDDFEKQIEDTNSSMAKFGFGASDSMQALTNLTSGTGSADTALQDMGVTANLAAAQHESLADAATQVVKIIEGKGTKTLAEYGITSQSATTATKALTTAQNQAQSAADAVSKAQQAVNAAQAAELSKPTAANVAKLEAAQQKLADAQAKAKTAQSNLTTAQQNAATATNAQTGQLGQLSDKLDGRAAASVSGFMGHLKVLKTEFENQAADLGQKYGPAIMGISGAMGIAGGAIEAGKGVIDLFRGSTEDAKIAQEGLTGATEASAIATDGLAGSELAADAAGLPLIGTIGLVVAAVVAVGVAAYELYQHWSTIWGGIKAAADAVWNGITAGAQWLWNQLVGIGDDIEGVFTGLWDGITGDARGFVNGLVGVFEELGNLLAAPIKDAINMAIIEPIDLLIDGINGGIGLLNDIPGVSIPHIPDIPFLADGGIVSSPTLAVIGEAGPEAVVPLSKGSAAAGFGGGDLTIVTPLQIDGRTFATQTAKYTRNELLRMGRGLPNLGLS